MSRGFDKGGNRRVRTLLFSVSLLFSCVAPVTPAEIELDASRSDAVERLVRVRDRLEEAARNGDRMELLAWRNELEELARQAEVSSDALYWSAYADAMVAGNAGEDEDELAREALEHGLARLLAALEVRSDWSEAWALLSLLRTQRLKLEGAAAFGLAGKAKQAMQRALELDPENPRVLMLHGVRLLKLPGLLGGNVKRSIEVFERARKAFATAPEPPPFGPRWGEPDNLSWLALARIRTGDLEGARAAMAACEARWPGFAHLRDETAPAFAAAEAKR